MHFFSFSFPVDNQRKVTNNEILVAVAFWPGADKQCIDMYHGPFIEKWSCYIARFTTFYNVVWNYQNIEIKLVFNP